MTAKYFYLLEPLVLCLAKFRVVRVASNQNEDVLLFMICEGLDILSSTSSKVSTFVYLH